MRRRSSGTHGLPGQSSGAEIILSLGLPTVLLQLGPKLRASKASQMAAIATVSAPGVAESPRGSAMLRSIQPRDALAVSPYHKALFL
jgi:hypothetical protein